MSLRALFLNIFRMQSQHRFHKKIGDVMVRIQDRMQSVLRGSLHNKGRSPKLAYCKGFLN